MADTSLLATGAVTFAAGAVFGWVALRTQRAHRRWCAERTRAEGVVSRFAERHRAGLSEGADGTSNDPGALHVAVVRFRASNGIEYEIDSPEGPMDLGAVVPVAYDPALPSDGRTVDRAPKIAFAVLLLALGAILVAVALTRSS
ncbi:MAG: DUF3592 domain-containing protein [Thermoanaerobaculia bacterium]